jgi:hypothetical protein
MILSLTHPILCFFFYIFYLYLDGCIADNANQLWLRFPDGTLCNPQDKAACLQADIHGDKLFAVEHSIPHTWSLTLNGHLRLDGTSKCINSLPDSITFLVDCNDSNKTFAFGNRLDFTPVTTPSALMHIYNFSTLNPDNSLVYIYGEFAPKYDFRSQVILSSKLEQGADTTLFEIVTFESAGVQAECQFHHPTLPVVTNQARYLWHMFTSSGLVCDLPALQDSPQAYIPRVVINDETFYAATPLTVIKPRKVRHTLCQCMVMWQRSEFLLEYMKFYTDVHGVSLTIILAQDQATFDSLKWLRTLYNIELIHWPHLYSQVSMTSYCTLLAQQQCEWVAQWDIDEFMYLPNSARLLDHVKQLASNTHTLLLELHLVQMFAYETVLRTPSGGVLRNFQCKKDELLTDKSLLNANNAHPTYVNRVHYYFGKENTVQAKYGTGAHYGVQSWELFMLKFRDVNLGQLFDNSNLTVDQPNELYVTVESMSSCLFYII